MHFARIRKALILFVTVLTIAGCATPAAPATPQVVATAPATAAASVTPAPSPTTTPGVTVTPPVTATPTMTVGALPGDTTAYQDAIADFEINYPSTWTLQDASPQAKQAGRGYYATMLSWSQNTPYAGEIPPGGTMVQVQVAQWEPLDLNQYVAMRKAAWAAVPVPIVLEEEWTLAGGVKAVRLSLKSDKGMTFILLTLINKRFLTISGEGDLELVAQIARTLRPMSVALPNAPATPMPGAATGRILFTSRRDGKM